MQNKSEKLGDVLVENVHTLSRELRWLGDGDEVQFAYYSNLIFGMMPYIINEYLAGEVTDPELYYVGNVLGVDLRIETEDGVI